MNNNHRVVLWTVGSHKEKSLGLLTLSPPGPFLVWYCISPESLADSWSRPKGFLALSKAEIFIYINEEPP